MKKQNYSVKCTTRWRTKKTKSLWQRKYIHHTQHGPTVLSQDGINLKHWSNQNPEIYRSHKKWVRFREKKKTISSVGSTVSKKQGVLFKRQAAAGGEGSGHGTGEKQRLEIPSKSHSQKRWELEPWDWMNWEGRQVLEVAVNVRY